MSKLNVAVLGYGYWGPNLVRNLRKTPSCNVIAIADLDSNRLEAAKAAHGDIDLVQDPTSVLERHDVAAVVIATPPSTHFELAKLALENGKHVLVEKPLAQNRSEAEELATLADTVGCTLMVDHTFLFSGAVRKIRDMIAEGELGDIWYVDSVRVDLGLFSHSENVIEDLAPHDFSILSYILDAKPTSVSSTTFAPIVQHQHVPPSLAYVTVQYDTNILAHLHLSWLSPIKIRRMLIGGSSKMLVYDHLDPDHQIKIYDKGFEFASDGVRNQLWGQRRGGDLYLPKVDQTEPLELLCDHFINCILTNQRPITDGLAGIANVHLVSSAIESMHQGGKTILL